MANNTKGSIARDLASAPLRPNTDETIVPPAAPETAMGAAFKDAIVENMLTEQAKTITAVVLPFTLAGFKLNGKAKDYPGDDDPTVISRKVAFAVLKLRNSSFTFQASIYRVTHSAIKDDKGRVKVATRCTMPNTGKMGGFKAVLDTDDAREQRALDEFKATTVREFKSWLAETAGMAAVQTKGTTHADELVEFE